MKNSTEKPLKAWLYPQATLSLLRLYSSSYEYTPYEERLLCALLQSSLLLLQPGTIIDATRKPEEEKARIMAAVPEGISVTPVVVSISGTDYLAKLEESRKTGNPVSLTLLHTLTDDQE